MKTIAKVRESDKGGRAKVKRIVMLLTVVALMVGMLAMSVAPAFAAWDAENGACKTGSNLLYIQGETDPYYLKVDRNNDWLLCFSPSNNRLYDNRPIPG